MKDKKGNRIRLLGIDPSPSLRAVIEQLGEDCGIGVDLCASLAEMRERLSARVYDLVVCASELPDGTSLDVLEAIRGDPRMKLAPVLLLIATRSENSVRQALDQGVTEVFSKQNISDLARYLESFSPSAPLERTGSEQVRALVVEDDRSLAAYYKELLAQHGFDVDHVPSGEAALWEARQRNYDFILVDLVLSGSCSGTQFLRRLREPGEVSSRAVAIAMSSYADEARRIEALRAGANAFIAKPVNERELSALIAGMAHRQSPSGTPDEAAGVPARDSTCIRCRPCQLTPRESNICGLVAAGYSDKRIAEEMQVSYWTVRTHIAHAFKKCQVSNRVELVRRLQGN